MSCIDCMGTRQDQETGGTCRRCRGSGSNTPARCPNCDHPSYDPLRRQIEALIRECDELRRKLSSEPLKAGMVIGLSEARADGYREAIADIAERTGCKTRPDEVSSLHEQRDALCNELRRRKSGLGHQALDTTATVEVADPLSALRAAEKAYLRARGWKHVERKRMPGWIDPVTGDSWYRSTAVEIRSRREGRR